KPLVGYSDITMLHLALYNAGVAGAFHGPYAGWSNEYYGPVAADHLRRALMHPADITVAQEPGEATAALIIDGVAHGKLMGGNLGTIARAVGWACPSFEGAILLLEAVDTAVGAIDSALT